MPTVYVLNLPEFMPVVDAARKIKCDIQEPVNGYWKIETVGDLVLQRKALGLSAALWNTALAGGVIGKIVQFDATQCTIVEESA